MLLAGVFMVLYVTFTYYIGATIYIWLRDAYAIKGEKTIIFMAFLLAFAYPIGSVFSFAPLIIIGGYWMVLMGYGLLVFPIANIVYFRRKRKSVKAIGWVVVTFYLLLFAIGTINAWRPVVKTYDITIQKETDITELKILMASDFHLNDVIKNHHLERLVKLNEEIKPDLVLLPGDLVDNSIKPYLRHQMSETMKKIHAPFGVYATMGNHENYGYDLQQIVEELTKSGVTVLEDETVLVGDAFYLVGRKDYHDKDRRSLAALTSTLDKTKPILMLEHQPVELDRAVENGIDLMVSGHTHRGQLYPGQLIAQMIFENAYGYLQKEQLHSIVTSGFGLWGPPLRIGSRSEVVVITIHFEQ